MTETKEERDALLESAREDYGVASRRETALLDALDDAEKRVRDIEDLRARIVSAMSCEPDDDSDLVEAVRENVRERDDAERERDAARAQLAALHAAASAVQTRARALPVSMTEIVHAEEWDDLDRTIADAAPTAAKHKRRVRAKVIAEVLGLYDGTNGCAAADLTPVIEAAQSLETRIRADERVRALREARERIERHDAAAYTAQGGCMEYWREGRESAAETLRAMADEAERGDAMTFANDAYEESKRLTREREVDK